MYRPTLLLHTPVLMLLFMDIGTVQMLAVSLSIGYGLLLLWYALGWLALPYFYPTPGKISALRFTVLLPFHNEAEHILACLAALAAQDYPQHLHEILLLDDGSTDTSPEQVVAWLAQHPNPHIRLIQLPKAGKKNALAHGVAQAKGSHIACTDADCTPPSGWLRLMAAAFEQQPNTRLVAGPVVFHRERGFVEWFQSLDLLGLMCVTGSGIHLGWQRMANGANLAYEKAAFEAVGGYSGNEHIASGDDLFLVQKIALHWPEGIFFLKNRAAAIPTLAMPTWRRLVRQRIRWGSKNVALPEWPVRLSLLFVFVVCWSIIALGVGALFFPHWMMPFWWILGAKLVSDCFFLGNMAIFFKKPKAMRWFIPAQIAHILYVAFIGLASILKRDQARW